MRRVDFHFIVVMVLISIVFLSCSNQSESLKQPDLKKAIDVKIALSDSAYALGSPIEFMMVVKNDSPDSVELIFPDACRFDFLLSNKKGEIWSFLGDKKCAQIISRNKLAPRDSLVLRSTWDGLSKTTDAELLMGQYSIIGVLQTYPPINTKPTKFYLVD
ncbi:hypothetical protein KAH81_06770 [bacterium]|nr:hypothetical protein [bacterium]